MIKVYSMAGIMDLNFPGQRTTTAKFCIPHDSAYSLYWHARTIAGKSENGILRERRATEKSNKINILPRMEERIFVVILWKKEKMFALFARKQREKIYLQVVDASTSNIQRSHLACREQWLG